MKGIPMTTRDDMNIVRSRLESWEAEARSGQGPVLVQPPMPRLAEDLDIRELISAGGLAGDRLDGFLETYLAASHRIPHPHGMGHQVACPHPSAVLGGYVDVFTNNPMAIYEMGPAAATVEYAVINWMLEKVGWKPRPWPDRPAEGAEGEGCGGGVLTHGGSLAQLTALAAARAHADPEAWENGAYPDLVVVSPPDAHYSVSRALGILGIGQKALVSAPCDDWGRILPRQLGRLLEELKGQGRRIMAVTANAGCTAAGLHDDFHAVADVCERHGVWLHVDGAHGASALLSPRLRHLLDGVERADSLIWDAHKMMRTPGLCAAVLFRDGQHLDGAFRQQASYLFHEKEQVGFDAIAHTVECTKAGLGVKFFFGLAAEGEKGLARYVEGRYALGAEVARLIATRPEYELAVEPEANIVCFRLKGLDDDAHLELRNRVLADGRYYITTTTFAGRRWLRLAIMNPETEVRHVERLLNLLPELAKDDT